MKVVLPPAPIPLERRIRIGDPVYFELVEFLYLEAALLDSFSLEEWKGLLAEDLVYCMPVRTSRMRDDGPEFSDRMAHFDDTYSSIVRRIQRLNDGRDNVWAENPVSRSRRFVSNILAFSTDHAEEFEVHSSILLVRYSGDRKDPMQISASRHDVVRRVSDGFRLARREIYVDQTRLQMANIGVFL